MSSKQFHVLLVLTAVVAGLTGCGGGSPAAGTFRLTVSDVFTDVDQRVSLLTIESPEAYGCSVAAGANTFCTLHEMARDPQRKGHRTQIWMAANRLSYGDKAYVQTIIRTEGAQSKIVREVSKSLEDSASLTIQDGSFPVAAPLVIGRLDGQDLTLFVGDTRKRSARR